MLNALSKQPEQPPSPLPPIHEAPNGGSGATVFSPSQPQTTGLMAGMLQHVSSPATIMASTLSSGHSNQPSLQSGRHTPTTTEGFDGFGFGGNESDFEPILTPPLQLSHDDFDFLSSPSFAIPLSSHDQPPIQMLTSILPAGQPGSSLLSGMSLVGSSSVQLPDGPQSSMGLSLGVPSSSSLSREQNAAGAIQQLASSMTSPAKGAAGRNSFMPGLPNSSTPLASNAPTPVPPSGTGTGTYPSSPSVTPSLGSEGFKKKRFKQVRKEDAKLAPISLTPEGLDKPAFLEPELLPKNYKPDNIGNITLRRVLVKLHALAMESAILDLTRDKMREFKSWNNVGVHLSSIWTLLQQLEELRLVSKEYGEHEWKFMPGFYRMMERIAKGLVPYVEECAMLLEEQLSWAPTNVAKKIGTNGEPQQPTSSSAETPPAATVESRGRLWPPPRTGMLWFDYKGRAVPSLALLDEVGAEAFVAIVIAGEQKARTEFQQFSALGNSSGQAIEDTPVKRWLDSDSGTQESLFSAPSPRRDEETGSDGDEEDEEPSRKAPPKRKRRKTQDSKDAPSPKQSRAASQLSTMAPTAISLPAASAPPLTGLFECLTVEGVSCWMEHWGFGAYAKVFADNKMTGRAMASATVSELLALGMGIGDATKLLQTLKSQANQQRQ